MSASQKQSFLHGALILSVGTALVKLIGALFKIPLQNLIGPVGMANFNVAYLIYTTLFVISTAGLPVAVSKMVSAAGAQRREFEIRNIFRLALLIFIGIGFVGTGFLLVFAQTVAGWMGNPDAAYAVMCISPAVLFVAVMSAFRGYHQGRGNMYPTAISQIIESLGKLLVGYALAYLVYQPHAGVIKAAVEASNQLGDKTKTLSAEVTASLEQVVRNASEPLAHAAAAAIAGVTIGALLGAVYMILSYRKRAQSLEPGYSRATRGSRELTRELLKIAIPVTISASVLNLTNLIDSGLVLNRLQDALGYTLQEAQKAYGSYTFAQTLFNMPPAFLLTIAVSIIPAISAAMTRRDHTAVKNTIHSALRINALLAMPAAAGLTALSFPLLDLLSGARQPEAVALAAPLLSTLGLAVFFVCLVTLTNAILQAMGIVWMPIITMGVGGVVKIVCNYILVGNPDIGIHGAPVGTLLCYAVIGILNMALIVRATGSVKTIGIFFRPFLASALMGLTAYGLQNFFTGMLGIASRLTVIVTVGLSVVFYFILVIFLRILTKEDLLMLPKGDKLARLFRV